MSWYDSFFLFFTISALVVGGAVVGGLGLGNLVIYPPSRDTPSQRIAGKWEGITGIVILPLACVGACVVAANAALSCAHTEYYAARRPVDKSKPFITKEGNNEVRRDRAQESTNRERVQAHP